MPEVYQAERTISAVFKEQKQVDDVIRRLLDRGVPRDHISVMGRNFQSETRIAGFITKRDVILGGLRTGAIFGSLFGSFLSLLTGVGVLFIPFVGPIVAAGPISALLLGAASGAIAGSAGAGLVSVLTTLGMPEDKAAIYQTRLQAGEFLLLTEVPSDRAGEFQLLLESAGGEEISTIDKTLTRPCPGPCKSPEDLSPEVRSHLSSEAQSTFIERYNGVLNETTDEFTAEQAAWEAVHQKFDEDENGVWSKAKVGV
ncbi:ChaB family protein [Nostoc parmelioides]|uniref:ChaB family protein n=1 Tax=Nostoc parmelioides FACHB-3921 TaxID=2692909 RepID=A0ABR8BDC7_9NOSO|nr:ChaB family protein [Nostoc parmelioides FACHB-3921]